MDAVRAAHASLTDPGVGKTDLNASIGERQVVVTAAQRPDAVALDALDIPEAPSGMLRLRRSPQAATGPRAAYFLRKRKPPDLLVRGFWVKPLAMTYSCMA